MTIHCQKSAYTTTHEVIYYYLKKLSTQNIKTKKESTESLKFDLDDENSVSSFTEPLRSLVKVV